MSTYIIPIKIGLIIFPILALLLTFPYMVKQYHKYGSILFLRTMIVYSFVLYLLIAWFMVILPLPRIEDVEKMTGPWAQLIPFQGFIDIFNNTNFNILNFSSWISFFKNPSVYTVLFNFLLTLPFGVYLRYYFKRKWWEVLTISFLLSLFFEVTQLSCLFGIYPRPYRLFDVDDLIVNTTGGLIGYLITPLLSKILPSREIIDEKSYTKGKNVSRSRTIVASFIDFIIVCIITFSGIFKRNYLDLSLLMYIFLIYNIIFTIIFNGRTIGKIIVGVRLVSEDNKRARINQILIRYIIKYFLMFEVYYVTFVIYDNAKLGLIGQILLILIYSSLLIIYFRSIICIFSKKKKFIYESLSRTKHISTIKNKEEKEV